ncbi:MAG: hypothetical protein K0S91_3220 [Nitrososphaeraceae archaeon]|nr:hypothetical protein [Nitrososphaeraceae archaeon]
MSIWDKNIVSITIHKPLSPRHICLFIFAQTNTMLMQITTDVIEVNLILNFHFVLKAPESKRQYPKRSEKLDYLKLDGTFEDKAL